MTRRAFIDAEFTDESLARIATCRRFLDEYARQGVRASLRQVYYRLVAANEIPNTPASYKALSALLSKARLAGLIDWDAIEDRTRTPHVPPEYEGLDDLIEEALQRFRLRRWAGQPIYAELMVEKDALSGLLRPIADEFHVPLVVNRGYASQTAMHDSAERIRAACSGPLPRVPVVFYIGDHDPSGEDMLRDVRERFRLYGVDVNVLKVALTKDQVLEHALPPNPAKLKDTRAAGYVAEHGPYSWEVDALPPDVLVALVRGAFTFAVVQDIADQVLRHEEELRQTLSNALASLRGDGPASS